MSTFQNDTEAHILAHTYGFTPNPGGLYESDKFPDAEKRWIRLCNRSDKTRILIKYVPTIMMLGD